MGDAPWPGRVPAPSPALVPGEPVGVDVFDDAGAAVMVNGRGDISAAPASIRFAGGASIGVAAWAGPWPLDERWWDPAQHRRRARLQVALTDDRALLLHVEHGEWSVEGFYD
jgi:protein ImuB